jgi:hypothetical protein
LRWRRPRRPPWLAARPPRSRTGTRDGERAIPRDQIADVDHPGNVAVVAGSVLLAAGTVNLLGVYRRHAGESSSLCARWAVGGEAMFGPLGGPHPGATLALSF